MINNDVTETTGQLGSYKQTKHNKNSDVSEGTVRSSPLSALKNTARLIWKKQQLWRDTRKIVRVQIS